MWHEINTSSANASQPSGGQYGGQETCNAVVQDMHTEFAIVLFKVGRSVLLQT